MLNRTRDRLHDELLAREKAYFDAVVAKNGDAAQNLSAEWCLVVGPRGAEVVDPQGVAEMVAHHGETQQYEMDDDSVTVVAINDDTGVISYRLAIITQKEDSRRIASSRDTSVWSRRNGEWLCAVHVSSPAGE